MRELEFMLHRKSCRVGFPWATVAADVDDDDNNEDEADEDRGDDDDEMTPSDAPTHVQPVYADIKLTQCSFVQETIERSSKVYLNSANADGIVHLLSVQI